MTFKPLESNTSPWSSSPLGRDQRFGDTWRSPQPQRNDSNSSQSIDSQIKRNLSGLTLKTVFTEWVANQILLDFNSADHLYSNRISNLNSFIENFSAFLPLNSWSHSSTIYRKPKNQNASFTMFSFESSAANILR